jgi:hypothetical protein
MTEVIVGSPLLGSFSLAGSENLTSEIRLFPAYKSNSKSALGRGGSATGVARNLASTLPDQFSWRRSLFNTAFTRLCILHIRKLHTARPPAVIYNLSDCFEGPDNSLIRRDSEFISKKSSQSCTPHTIKMKVFSNDCTFNYSWEEVSTGNWVKYCPWNDKSTHVIAVDTLSRQVDPDTGIVRHPPFFQMHQGTNIYLATNRTSHHLQTKRSEMAQLPDG